MCDVSKVVRLSDGIEMPTIGLGTYALRPCQIPFVIREALKLGYLRFDMAWRYFNERTIGKTLKKEGIARERIFLASKLHVNDLYPSIRGRKIPHFPFRIKTIRSSFEQTLRRLHTDYLDLYMLHWPFEGYVQMWRELLKLKDEGLVKALGVTYFTRHHLEHLYRETSTWPAYNQIELSPFNTNKPLIDFCKEKGIAVEGYSTFGTGFGRPQADTDLMNHPTLLAIARKHGKSVAQIILRWAIEQGVCVIPRSSQWPHLKENIEIFDFALNNNEREAIDSLNRNRNAWFNPPTIIY